MNQTAKVCTLSLAALGLGACSSEQVKEQEHSKTDDSNYIGTSDKFGVSVGIKNLRVLYRIQPIIGIEVDHDLGIGDIGEKYNELFVGLPLELYFKRPRTNEMKINTDNSNQYNK